MRSMGSASLQGSVIGGRLSRPRSNLPLDQAHGPLKARHAVLEVPHVLCNLVHAGADVAQVPNDEAVKFGCHRLLAQLRISQ